MTLEELRNAVCRHIDENRDAYNETGDECYRAVKEELLHILGLIDTVDHEPAGKDKMTLTELARELRRMFDFEYLTCEILCGCRVYIISLWNGKPRWKGSSWWWCDGCNLIVDIKLYMKFIDLDLFEYNDADGIIDYSKCIVEVE